MKTNYVPRRAGLKRWLKGAPDYILDVLNVANCADHYVVFLGKQFIFHIKDGIADDGPDEFGNTHVAVLFMSDEPSSSQGVSIWDTMTAYNQATYRYNHKHRRIRWKDLPDTIRKHVISRATL
jgi:hypothetical protein